MGRDLKPLRNKMVTFRVYDGWQFVQSVINSIDIARYCIDIIEKIIKQNEDCYNEWFEKSTLELDENNEKMDASIDSDILPVYSIKVADVDIDSRFLLQKLTKDFFQYIRNTFDYMAQIVNTCCLRERGKETEKVDFAKMNKLFAQQPYSQEFPDIHAWFEKVNSSQEYVYLNAFCNRIKHNSNINIKFSVPFFGGESKVTVNPFYKDNTNHPSRDIKTYLEFIWKYVFKELCTFLALIEAEIEKKPVSNNRFHQLLGYQQINKDSSENSFAYVYVEAPENDIKKMPDEIRILFVHQEHTDSQVDAYNCRFNNIYIANPQNIHDIIGVYRAESDWHPEQILYYRKYMKHAPQQGDEPLLNQIMSSAEHRNIRFFKNPYISFMSVGA